MRFTPSPKSGLVDVLHRGADSQPAEPDHGAEILVEPGVARDVEIVGPVERAALRSLGRHDRCRLEPA